MSDLSKNAQSQYYLDGSPFNSPLDWQEDSIEANYENDSIQPSLTIKEFVFPLEAKESIKTWFESGLNGGVGCFEGMPFQLRLFNNNLSFNFNGFIDFTNGYRDLLDEGTSEVSLIKEDGIDNFLEQAQGITFGYLESIGAVGVSDYITVDYVVEKKFNLIELIISSLVLYLMIKELAEAVEKTAIDVSTVIALSSIPLGGVIGSVILFAAQALIRLAYTVILLLAVIDMANTLYETLLPPLKEHKAILLRRALEVVCNYLGYQLNAPSSSIAELDYVYYLPSNPNLDDKNGFGFISQTKGTQSGIPNTLDFGYNCAEMFKIALDTFNAKMKVSGNTVEFRTKNDSFWIQTSNWIFPDKLIEVREWNLPELATTRLISFKTDINDEWTIDQYGGTAIEIKTFAPLVIRKNAQLLKGIDEVTTNCALGNRKNQLNALEKLLKGVGGALDAVTGIFGGGSNFSSKVQGKVGVLKQSENYHSVPKLLYLKGGKLPVNHRTLWNAQILYFKYHKEKSFVLDNWTGQKVVYNDVEVPFGIEDFNILSENPYFNFNNGIAKMTKFVWTPNEDTATISFYQRQPYTNNLAESYIIPT